MSDDKMLDALREIEESELAISRLLSEVPTVDFSLGAPDTEKLYAALHSACGESCSATEAAMGACMDFMRATIEKHEKAREFWADLSVHLAQNQAYAGRIPDYVERLATRRHPMLVEAQAVAVAETAALYRQQLAAPAPNHSEQVQEGWKLVPSEPTPKAVGYFYGQYTRHMSMGVGRDRAITEALRYTIAMLAAAPSAVSQKEQGE